MKMPETPDEFGSILYKLSDDGYFKVSRDGEMVPINRQVIEGAISEFVRTVEEALDGIAAPSATERLVGLLFISAIEQYVSSQTLVTIEETPNP